MACRSCSLRRRVFSFSHCPAQEGPDTPSFRSEASAITVDVVVLDDDGRPVRGLTRDDFTVREDGREQTLVGFEARDLKAPAIATHEPRVPGDLRGRDRQLGRGRVDRAASSPC